MVRVMYARLCRTIRRDKQTGLYSLVGSFATLDWTPAPTHFVLVIYWKSTNETFRQSFAVTDANGNILDQTPTTQCVLKDQQINLSTAFFYTVFPRAGQYNINIYQNGICTEDIPLSVLEVQQTSDRRQASFAPLRGTA